MVTNKETSWTIIYIKFGRIKSKRMQRYAEVCTVVLSHSFHVQLASGVSLLTSVSFFCSYNVIDGDFSSINSETVSDFLCLLNTRAIKSVELITAEEYVCTNQLKVGLQIELH